MLKLKIYKKVVKSLDIIKSIVKMLKNCRKNKILNQIIELQNKFKRNNRVISYVKPTITISSSL